MLTIRLARAGRKGIPFFRVVLTEQHSAPKSGFIKVLGHYDPRTKNFSIDQDALKFYCDHGAQMSATVRKLSEKKV